MEFVWYLDRAAGLVAYVALYAAVLTGILYNARGFGVVRDAARRVHVEVSVVAIVTMLLHGVLGLVDAWKMRTGAMPEPTYGTAYLLVGVAVGVGAMAILLVSVLGFVDARRFERPWSPTVVHAFAYAGFAFATVHAAAIGTDVVAIVRPGIIAAIAFLVYVLLLRTVHRVGVLGDGTSAHGGGQ